MAGKRPDYEIGEIDQYLFGIGKHRELYRKLGAHPVSKDGKPAGVYFAVWAPHACKVSVVGEFNKWDPSQHVMLRLGPVGIYALLVPEAVIGQLYKFCILTEDGEYLYKADPFAVTAELRPGTASRIARDEYDGWSDEAWMDERSRFNHMEKPVSIYECHIGAWKRHPGRMDDGFYNYCEFARSAVEYMQEMHYTHIELMGVPEYPYDGSWGYQVTGYFAPTSRYGTPEDFAYMVNYFHRHGIGVILDWVPAHFPKDEHGLAMFDGTPTYEYEDPLKREQTDWNTLIFDYGKSEVRGFLIASALSWVERYHIDGLRVDAVAAMLYLDYGKKEGQWRPNSEGGNSNTEAVSFLKELNETVLSRNPGVMMIAEESTAWPKVTWPPADGGLGFNLKWNMGWMHDFLEYMKLDPYFRGNAHNMMTFASSYAYSENFVLVLSHDEVVHMKGSMYGKMPGDEKDKIANLKAGYAFMMAHPGKKLLFMGQDFAQIREWSEARELDWGLLEDEQHAGLNRFVAALNKLYSTCPALYDQDCVPDGMQWINADDGYRSIYSFIRHSREMKDNLLVVINFTPVARDDYRVGVPESAELKLVLRSDDPAFGGTGEDSGKSRPIIYQAKKGECDGQPYSFAYPLPAYGVAVFEYHHEEESTESKSDGHTDA